MAQRLYPLEPMACDGKISTEHNYIACISILPLLNLIDAIMSISGTCWNSISLSDFPNNLMFSNGIIFDYDSASGDNIIKLA